MKKASLLLFGILASASSAQEKEIWACQSNDSNGFRAQDGRWEEASYAGRNLLFTFDSTSSALKFSDANITRNFSCDSLTWQPSDSSEIEDDLYRCYETNTGMGVFSLNPSTGDAGYGYILGAVTTGGSNVYVELFHCTRF